MKKEQKGELNIEERVLADEVADGLINEDNKEKRKFLIFLLIFIICLTFLISSVSFAIISTYHSGSHDNVINANSVLFSFTEDSNHIKILNAYPTSDEIGKSYNGHNQYFDFSVSVGFSKKSKDKNLKYEVSLIPLSGNTLDSKYIRVYLTENNREVSIKQNTVNNFSDLDKSSKFNNGRILVIKKVTDNTVSNYRLRLWLSDQYQITGKSQVFKCKVAVATHKD